MSLPAIIIIVLGVSNAVAGIFLHGTLTRVNAYLTLLSTFIYGLILAWGGFFS